MRRLRCRGDSDIYPTVLSSWNEILSRISMSTADYPAWLFGGLVTALSLRTTQLKSFDVFNQSLRGNSVMFQKFQSGYIRVAAGPRRV